jgi:hypothetical protein
MVMVSTIKDAIAGSKNREADYFLKYHTYFSILHGLVSIQMIEKAGKPGPEKKMILQDAISGFITSLVVR